MAKKVSPKTFTYKSARFLGSQHELGTSLAQALRGAPTLADRRQPLGSSVALEWLLLNEYRIHKGFVGGELISYAPGTAAAALVDDPTANTAPVSKYNAPSQGGKAAEWLDSVLYFTAYKNHIVLLQSAALRSSQLEGFLRWFLSSRPQTQNCGSLELNDRPAKVTLKKLRDVPVRRIEIGGALTSPTFPTEEVEPALPKVAQSAPGDSKTFAIVGNSASTASSEILNALSVLAGKVNGVSDLNLKGLDDSQVSYKLLLTIDRRKTREDNSQDVLNRLGHALRHAEGVDTKIELSDGTQVRGDDLRLTGKVSVTLYDGLPSASEVFDLMEHWLLEKAESGDIEAT